ncbi:MAG: glycoside hydrolase family 2, partial [Lachnospiraceae bacterium]|nr:glycoside hydrolase family 2 [Lachnospiraceae bacterium]
EIYPNLSRGLSSAIYTQTSDIEEEVNGIMTYDREIDKLGMDTVYSLNQKLYQMFNELTK